MTIGILLSGCGVFDGAEIHETVLSMLAIQEAGHNYICLAPDKAQMHVLNHINGEEMNQERNLLVEAGRIARGAIQSLSSFDYSHIDALWLPGGFGVAKNFTDWAINGPSSSIDPEIQKLIQEIHARKKPIVALCMAPVVIAKALEGVCTAKLTVGTSEEKSDYDIKAISEGMESLGSEVEQKSVKEISVDKVNKIISAPCYMMEASISEVNYNVKLAVEALLKMSS